MSHHAQPLAASPCRQSMCPSTMQQQLSVAVRVHAGHEQRAKDAQAEVVKGNHIIEKLTVGHGKRTLKG